MSIRWGMALPSERLSALIVAGVGGLAFFAYNQPEGYAKLGLALAGFFAASALAAWGASASVEFSIAQLSPLITDGAAAGLKNVRAGKIYFDNMLTICAGFVIYTWVLIILPFFMQCRPSDGD